jgi:hypothetical protein
MGSVGRRRQVSRYYYRAAMAKQEAEKLKVKLRELGIDPG